MATPQVTFEPIQGLKPQARPQQPTALFVEGVPDDGMVRVTAKVPHAEQAAFAEGVRNKAKTGTTALNQRIPCNLNQFAKVPGLAHERLVLVPEEQQMINVSMPKVIVNLMVDPDVSGRALTKLEGLITRLSEQAKAPIPVVNPPAGIRRSARDAIYQQFKDLPGIIVPRVIRITPNSVADVIQQVKNGGIELPFLIRQAGAHDGTGLQRIGSWAAEDLLKLERYAYDGRAFYVTQWMDYPSTDGLYRKERILWVGGQFLTRHRIIADDWDIHVRWRDLMDRPGSVLRQEEAAFLAAPLAQSMSADAYRSLQTIQQTLGLDFFAIDCSIRPDGSLLIFEINAAVNAMRFNPKSANTYLRAPIERINAAFSDMIADKAGLRRAAA